MWKHSHNEIHHTYTNVVGKDNDLGYGIMRVDEDQRWMPFYLAPAAVELPQCCFFQYGIAAYDLELGKHLKGRGGQGDVPPRRQKCSPRSAARCARTTSLHPLLSGPSACTTLAANVTANLVRNVWTHSVIMCGHFPEGVETFAEEPRSTARPAASGTCARCSARPTSRAARSCTS